MNGCIAAMSGPASWPCSKTVRANAQSLTRSRRRPPLRCVWAAVRSRDKDYPRPCFSTDGLGHTWGMCHRTIAVTNGPLRIGQPLD
jgi:hypothetical protein